MLQLVGVSGSLRRGSFNTALLRAAQALVPADVTLEIHSIRDIPLYDADVEAEGLPAAVVALKQAIAGSAGLLLATPEYNNSLSGVLKNAIDWLSRPATDITAVFGGRPVAVLGASAGGFGTILSQNAWLPVLRTLRMRPWFTGRLLVSHAQNVFDDAGRLQDAGLRRQLQQFMEGFVDFVRQQTAATVSPARRPAGGEAVSKG